MAPVQLHLPVTADDIVLGYGYRTLAPILDIIVESQNPVNIKVEVSPCIFVQSVMPRFQSTWNYN